MRVHTGQPTPVARAERKLPPESTMASTTVHDQGSEQRYDCIVTREAQHQWPSASGAADTKDGGLTGARPIHTEKCGAAKRMDRGRLARTKTAARAQGLLDLEGGD